MLPNAGGKWKFEFTHQETGPVLCLPQENCLNIGAGSPSVGTTEPGAFGPEIGAPNTSQTGK